MKLLGCAFIAAAVSACSSVRPPACPPPITGDVVYVVGQSWHAQIGIPVEELGDDLAFYREIFPGARVIIFGYGKKTFFTAPPETLSEYILGPVPGPAVIQAVGLTVTPMAAYSSENILTLRLPPGGIHRSFGPSDRQRRIVGETGGERNQFRPRQRGLHQPRNRRWRGAAAQGGQGDVHFNSARRTRRRE